MKQGLGSVEGRDALPLNRIWEFLDTSSLLSMAQASTFIRDGIVQGEESKALWRKLWLWDTPHLAYRRDGGEVVMEDEGDDGGVKSGGPGKEEGSADLSLADSRLWNGSRNYETYTRLRNLEADTIACIQNCLFRTTGAGTLIKFMRHHMGLSNLNAGYNYSRHNIPSLSATKPATIGTSSTSRSDRPGAEWETSLCGLYGATSTYRPPTHFTLDQKRYCYASMKVFIRLLSALQALLDYDLQIYTRDEETFDFNTDAEVAFAARDLEALKGAVNHLFPSDHAWYEGAPLISAFILPPASEPGKPLAFNEMEVMAIRKFILCGLAYVKGVETTHVWDRVLVRYSDTCNSSFAVMQPDGKALTKDDGPQAAKERQEVAFGGRFDEDDDTSTLLSGFHAVGNSKLSIPYQRSFVECSISACAVFVWKAIFGDKVVSEGPGHSEKAAQASGDFPSAFFRSEFFETDVFGGGSTRGSSGGGQEERVGPVNAIRDMVCAERLEGESGVAIATARTLATVCDFTCIRGLRGASYTGPRSYSSGNSSPYSSSLTSQSRAIEGAAEIRKMLREKARGMDVGKVLAVVVKVIYGSAPLDPSIAAAIAATNAKKKKGGGGGKDRDKDKDKSALGSDEACFGMAQPPNTDSGYYAICNSLLDNVCFQRQGLPLSLAAFVVAVCGEVGAHVLHDTPAGRVPTYANQSNFRYRPKVFTDRNNHGICMVGAPSHITIGIGKVDNESEVNKEHGFLLPEAARTTLTHFCDPFEPWSTKTPRQWFQDRLNVRGEALTNLTRSKEHSLPAKHLDMWRRALRNLSSARMKNLGKLYPEALREGWPAARARSKPPLDEGGAGGGGTRRYDHPNKGTPVEGIKPLSRQSRYFSAYIDTVSSLYVNQMQLEVLEEWAMLETLRWNFIAMGKASPRPPGEAMNTDVRTTPAYDVGAGGTLLSPNMDMVRHWHSMKSPEGCNGSVFTSYIEIAELIMSGGNGGRVHCAAILGLPEAVHDAKYQVEHNISMMSKIRNHAPIGKAERFVPPTVREYFVKWLAEANMRESELLR